MCACQIKPVIRVVSLDVTGTLVQFSESIGKTYARCAQNILSNPPTEEELDVTFRKAFKQVAHAHPCYGAVTNISEREWWRLVVLSTIEQTGRSYPQPQFDDYFRRVRQRFASREAFDLFHDTMPLLHALRSRSITAGILTNSPQATVEHLLPLLDLHTHLHWFVSCQDVGFAKPDRQIFDHTFERLKRQHPTLRRDEIVHIGDNYELDYLGARNAGWQALLLNRAGNKLMEEKAGRHSIRSLAEVLTFIDS